MSGVTETNAARPDAARAQRELYERIRAYAAAWSDGDASDPGIAMAELFAYLADALAAYQDAVGREAYLGWRRYLSVHLQEGRVAIDSDWDEAATAKYFGLYRGVVVDAVDPQMLHRLRVEVPAVLGSSPEWALPSIPPGAAAALPSVGAVVWVAYEEGDVDRPVWLGVLPTGP
jgi:Type VI secretion system/phage-baseplate injector OB domain